MAFPLDPTNGEQTTQNGILYIYDSALSVWSVLTNTEGNIGVNNLVAAGSVTSEYFVGNGSQLTGLDIDATSIQNGTSNVQVLTSSNIVVSVAGTSNIAAFSNNGFSVNSIGIGVDAPATTGQLLAIDSITAFYSDERLKKDFRTIECALDKIEQLTGYLYTQNELAEQFGYHNYNLQVGLKASDVLKVQPEAVKLAPFDTAPNGTSKTGENYLTVQYEKLIPLLVEGIKELRREINQLKGK